MYGEWVNLATIVFGTWFYEHPYCTDSHILLFFFFLTNVLHVSRFGEKCLLNVLNVNVTAALFDVRDAELSSTEYRQHTSLEERSASQ